MKILLAEDFEDNRFFLTLVLESYGYEVIAVQDGQQAWETLQQRNDINLVLSDWVMPNIDGLELCQLIRDSLLSRYVYIILMTARGEETAVVKGMEAGADDFLRKPVEPEELRVRLNAGQRVIALENTLAEHNQKLQDAYNQILLQTTQLKQELESKRQDLASAAEMQQDLLPEPKILANLRFDRLFYPCQFIAGDTFNFFELGEYHIGFYQLDVSGHELRSALLSFMLYHRIANEPYQRELLLRKINNEYQPVPPEQVLYALNNRFQSSAYSKLYFTMVYGYIHKQTGEVQFVQAGHPSPIYIANASNKATLCGEGGFPVGLLPDLNYERITLWLQPGDRLFLYSDGITECMNQEDTLFSEERLLNLLETTCYYPLPQVLEQVGIALQAWHGGNGFEDDVTLLAIERL